MSDMAIGILKPEEAGAKARAAVDQWKKEKKKKEKLDGRAERAKPAPEAPKAFRVQLVPEPATPAVVAPSAPVQGGALTLERKNEMLRNAAILDDVVEAKRLLAAGANVDGISNGPVCTAFVAPLLVALERRSYNVAKLLVENGANLERTDGDLATPILIASKNHLELVEEMLKRGANVRARDKDGDGALDFALMNRDREMAKVLRRHGATLSQKNQHEINQRLLEAAWSGDSGMIGGTLDYGASHEACNQKGENALVIAAAKGNLIIVSILLENKFDVNGVSCGSTALMYAAREGKEDVVRRLIRHGADVNSKDLAGFNALLLAALRGNSATAKCLLENGAGVDAMNANGNTALMLAAEKGHLETVQVLVESGAEVNMKDAQGNTALKHARLHKHDEVAKYLKAHGAKRWFI